MIKTIIDAIQIISKLCTKQILLYTYIDAIFQLSGVTRKCTLRFVVVIPKEGLAGGASFGMTPTTEYNL